MEFASDIIVNPYPEPTGVLRQNASGQNVRWLQWMLNELGYPLGMYGIDGSFGPSTRAAVLIFQADAGLNSDGAVGPLTRAALRSAYAAQVSRIPPGPYQTGKIADVSSYQGIIDWEQAARELDFAIIRTQAGMDLDSLFALNVAGAQANDVPFGVYAYMRSGAVEDAIEEARRFYNRARYANPTFYVVDVENLYTENMREAVSAFIAELRRLGVQKIGLYIAHHLYEPLNLATEEADFIWIPRYGENTGFFELLPDYPADLVQYTSRGRLAGVEGDVDLNALTGTIPLEWFITY